jgi:hypothetical protein
VDWSRETDVQPIILVVKFKLLIAGGHCGH